MQETILLSIRQHISKYIFRLPRWFWFSIVGGIMAFFLANSSYWVGSIAFVLILSLGFYLEWRRFVRSKLVITNLRVYLSVMKWISSGFEAGLHYRQIKNCAFRKEHMLHTMTNSGTLYLRAGGDEKEQIAAEYVPNVEKVCKIINWLLALNDERRGALTFLPDTM